MTLIPSTLTLEQNTNQTLVFTELQTAQIHAKRDSNTVILALLTEEPKDEITLNFNLDEEGSHITFIGLIIAKDSQNYKIKTISNHHSPHTEAYYYIRSAMFDKSNIDYYGNLIIEKIAQHTDCYLVHNSLMLSPNAHTDTEPCLEIEADSVAAGHAATVGRVDEKQLFYLKSRGLNTKEAQALLIQGFMEADLSHIKDEQLRQQIITDLEKHLACLTPQN